VKKINESNNFNHVLRNVTNGMGEEFERAWMKAVAILITYCKLFIAINKSSFDENLLFITDPKSEVQVKSMTEQN
jgi:hypothetical protein